MENRVEIYRDNAWHELRLKDSQSIKYNTVINKIGEVSNRQISHSNTFSIPNISQNQKALGLNVFNPREMSAALNSKYRAKYYIGGRLIKEGFIVINNSEKEIKLNFLDASLGLVDTWKRTTFKSLLKNPLLERPSDYQAAINEMSAYDMSGTGVWSQLSNVGSRGYPLALFPNTLNQIGSNFQKGVPGVREDDVFIPSQSRPVFNIKSILDLATETYGYTPIYDESIDWDSVESKFFSGENANEGSESEGSLLNITYPQIPISRPYTYMVYFPYAGGDPSTSTSGYWLSKVLFEMPSERGILGSYFEGKTITGINFNETHWNGVEPPYTGPVGENESYFFDKNIIYVPETSGGGVGEITFSFDYDAGLDSSYTKYFEFYAFWETGTAGTLVAQNIPHIDDPIDETKPKIDKSFLNTPPAGATSFVGITFKVVFTKFDYLGGTHIVDLPIYNMQVTEQAIPQGEVAFGGLDEYLASVNDLTHAASEKTVKELVSGVLHYLGGLLYIDDKEKTVKFFSYGQYQRQKEDGEYYDWSEYLQKGALVKRNTDYGGNYGRINKIGLKGAYPGNSYIRELLGHIDNSKYKAFSVNELKDFNDIKSVKSIENTLHPYFEYEVSGTAMVEKVDEISGLTQKSVDGTVHGVLNNLPHISNVNYYNIPNGVSEWYNIVDRALRVFAKFNLPENVIKSFDITKPIYVEGLGGFYIVEEIPQYENRGKVVEIKLIKLIENLMVS